MRLDNEEIEIEAVSCVVANSGNLGIADLTLDSTINIRDGFLDVLLVRKIDLENFLAVASSALCWNTAATPLPHWQVRSLQIDANPQQRVAVDGEMWGFTPLNANIIPAALNVILPPPQNDG
jgi:diacylglycerol kinase family enzyme